MATEYSESDTSKESTQTASKQVVDTQVAGQNAPANNNASQNGGGYKWALSSVQCLMRQDVARAKAQEEAEGVAQNMSDRATSPSTM